jgi:hypothetical protein
VCTTGIGHVHEPPPPLPTGTDELKNTAGRIADAGSVCMMKDLGDPSVFKVGASLVFSPELR